MRSLSNSAVIAASDRAVPSGAAASTIRSEIKSSRRSLSARNLSAAAGTARAAANASIDCRNNARSSAL